MASKKSLMLIFLRFTGSKDFTSSIFSSLKEKKKYMLKEQYMMKEQRQAAPYWTVGGVSCQSGQV